MFDHEEGMDFLKISVGNIQKTTFIEKGISTLALQRQFLKAIETYLKDKSFDLIIITTPPTTLARLVGKLKKHYQANCYLLLKDIFPQNSIDLGILKTSGIGGLLYRYFKRTERETYAVADWIGCMSEANRRYLISHEEWLDPSRVEVNPNSLRVSDRAMLSDTDRETYNLPKGERVYVYGGNLGKPQAIDFLLEVLEKNEKSPVGHFVIAGEGTERRRIERFFDDNDCSHSTLLPALSRQEFDCLLKVCDAGLVLLDYRFTIPNFPSRILSYMQAGLPLLIAADSATDLGSIAEENGFGVSCFSDDAQIFLDKCAALTDNELRKMGIMARQYLVENYSVDVSYELIMEHFND